MLFYTHGLSRLFAGSFSAKDNPVCELSFPCSIEAAASLTRENDTLLIMEKYADRQQDLERLSNSIGVALSAGATVVSDGMIVNGTCYQTENMSFIIGHRANYSSLVGFTFTGFHDVIIALRTVNFSSIIKCKFINNHFDNSIGMIETGFTEVFFYECEFVENSAFQSSLVNCLTSIITFEHCKFERNYISHNSSQPLIYCGNGIFQISNSVFRHNFAPFSPLFSMKFRSYFLTDNVTFEENDHPDLWVCDSTCHVYFEKSKFMKNRGTIFRAVTPSHLYFNKSIISNNWSPQRPLFEMDGGYVESLRKTLIISNDAESIFNIKGKAQFVFNKTLIKKNRIEHSIFQTDENAEYNFSKVVFVENTVGQSIFDSVRSSIKISKSKVMNHTGRLYLLKDCSAMIEKLSIYSVYANEIPIIIDNMENSSIVQFSQFHGGNTVYLKASGNVELDALRFDFSSKNSVNLSRGLECQNCKFGSEDDGFVNIDSSKRNDRIAKMIFAGVLVALLIKSLI